MKDFGDLPELHCIDSVSTLNVQFSSVDDELEFDWDAANIKHLARHNVEPAEAEQVILNDPVDIEYQAVKIVS